ncbi:DUF624 domain-containing protein [Sinomonas sp. P47F7]|uniref:DUF624 domain-containing protein n=1 Tax=Sinomonas sp. P47F7 TaxID=3410987 RepID=UPI003BF5516C
MFSSLLGLGPATLAAHELVRRRELGETGPVLRPYVAALRGSWPRGLALGLPLEAAWAAVAVNWLHFSASHAALDQGVAGAVAFAGVYLAAVTCLAFPLAARYDVPAFRALAFASRFVPRQLPGVALVLFIGAVVLFASVAVPGLVPFASAGAWIMLTGHVCHRLFEANDASVAEAEASSKATVRQAGADAPSSAKPRIAGVRRG